MVHRILQVITSVALVARGPILQVIASVALVARGPILQVMVTPDIYI